MIPGNRVRAKRRNLTNIVLDQVVTKTSTNADATGSITLSTSAYLVVIISSNIDSVYVNIDGVKVTELVAVSNFKIHAINLAAGTHTITVTSGGSWKSFIAASYLNVSSASAAGSATGSSTAPLINASGSGALAIAGFMGSRVDDAATVASSGTIVSKLTGSNDSYSMALVSNSASSIGLTLAGSISWLAAAVWLN